MGRNWITAVLGIALAILGIINFISGDGLGGIIPFVIGVSLAYLAFRPGRVANIIFGHACIVIGCMLVTMGLYSMPGTPPTMANVLAGPLFWGLISIFGGICANYHGFCKCVGAK
jgi:hypothetical protein